MTRLGTLVACIALVVIAAPAWAAGPPYTVSVGGSSAAGTHSFTGASAGAIFLRAKNNSGTVVNYTCTSAAMGGTITSGSGVNPWLKISSSTWTGCRTVGGALSVTQGGTWNYTGTGSNATSGTETVAGAIGDILMTWQTTPSTVCSFTVIGQARSSFNEANQRLTVAETGYTGNLVLSGVSGCLGQIQSGNKVDLELSLDIASPDGAINLS